jgi:PAS domain S-box-containing protein
MDMEVEGLQEVGIRRHQRKDGSIMTVSVTRHTLEHEGKPAILALIRDITEHHTTQEALKEKDELFRLMVEGSKDYGVFLLDSGGRVLTWNEGAQRNTGYFEDEIVGRHCSCFYTPEDIRLGKPDATLIIAESKGRCEEQGWHVRKDGSRFYADTVLCALRDSSGRLRGFVCIRRDITEKLILEQKLLEIAEREQKRIGQDLHDSLGQRLTGIGLLAKALEERLAAQKRPEAKEAAVLGKQLAEASNETRRLARGLYSADLEANRLVPALKQLLDDARLLFGIEGKLDAAADTQSPDSVVSAQLYHIAQEAIHNAVRHGKAKKIAISLEVGPAAVTMTVTDDGTGIPPEPPKGGGMGLRIMNYRASLIGGQVSVSPHASGGTVVVCRVSVPTKNGTMQSQARNSNGQENHRR